MLSDDLIIIRDNEGDDPLFAGPWDLIWRASPDDPHSGQGDYAIADPVVEGNNIGGFQALDRLDSAITMCLFVDRKRPSWMPADSGSSPRGWAGDAFDIDIAAGERELGSFLWTLERAPLTAKTARDAIAFAREALQTLIDQGEVGKFDITSEIRTDMAALFINIFGYSVTGQKIYENAFPVTTR